MIIKLLDHGSVALVETWGSDERIVEAARMSTDKGFQGWGRKCDTPGCMPVGMLGDVNFCQVCKGTGWINGDEKLLRYLYEHKHMTPFEMAGMIVEVQAPIFVFREWHRHRTQSYNELSARYTPLPDVNYVPTVERLLQSGGANKQAASTGKQISVSEAEGFQKHLAKSYVDAQELYEWALLSGAPKELARLCIPVGRYSRMRASANLRNWLAFLTLRMDAAAQWEIQQYAKAVAELIAEKFPRTYALFAKK
jgi:thymidylate synthase (FAD)